MKRIPAKAILRFVRRLEREDVNLYGFELRHRGEARAEGYYAPFVKGEPHRVYSVSKSMVSLAVGLLAEEGKIALDSPVAAYFEDKLPPAPDPRVLRVTVRDMLRMATCHARTAYVGEDYDWTASFFTAQPSHEPGTVFSYDTSSSHVLGALCERASGMGLLEFLDTRIFQPIGATDEKRWLADPSGVPRGGSGLMMSLRDMGKVAQLVMDGGAGLLPVAYLAQATGRQIETPFQEPPEERYGYGYQFWRTRTGYAMYGMGGQLAVCCPEKTLLLSAIADTRLDPYGVQRIYDAFFEEIYEAELAGTDEGEVELADALASLRVRAVEHAPAYQGHFQPAYQMRENAMGLREARFDGQAVTLVWRDEEHRLAYGVGEVRQGMFKDTPCLTSGGWIAPGVLCVRCNLIGDSPCGMELLFAQSGDHLTVQARRSNDPLTVGYEGFAGT